jgi:hypothetical protein
MYRTAIALALFALVPCVPAGADYILTPLSGAADDVTLEPNDTLIVELAVTTDAADSHDSAIFRVVFSQPGLVLESYQWHGNYGTNPDYDDSFPLLAELPLAVTAGVFPSLQFPGEVDVEMSNLTEQGLFGEGTLVTLTLTIPGDFPEGTFTVAVAPDTFDGPGGGVPTTPGSVLTVHIVPEPACLLTLAAAAPLLARRRRRR